MTARSKAMTCLHEYEAQRYCGVEVCYKCGYHKGLARCYCGWNLAAGERLEDDLGEATYSEEGGWEVDY